jgi:hypothetical protein
MPQSEVLNQELLAGLQPRTEHTKDDQNQSNMAQKPRSRRSKINPITRARVLRYA